MFPSPMPFRNAHFLAAAGWAEVLGRQVVIGAIEQDSSTVGTAGDVPGVQRADSRAGTKDGTIRVETPLIHPAQVGDCAAGS